MGEGFARAEAERPKTYSLEQVLDQLLAGYDDPAGFDNKQEYEKIKAVKEILRNVDNSLTQELTGSDRDNIRSIITDPSKENNPTEIAESILEYIANKPK